MTWLTTEEAAEHLRVCRATLWKWISHREIPTYKKGGTVRISQEDLDAFMQSGVRKQRAKNTGGRHGKTAASAR